MPGRAVEFVGPRSVEVRETPVPEPDPGEVRVSTTVSAISPGTELLVYAGDAPSEMAADGTIDAIEGTLSFPLRYGYAAVGEVAAAGDDVPAGWLGETVFAFHPHASHFLAEPSELHRVPADCPPEAAALLPNVETAVNLVLDGRPRIGERVALFGQGVVGLLTTGLLSAFPLASLVAVEPLANRRRAAEAFGAGETLDPGEADVRERLGDADGLDLAYEVSGDPAALDDALAATGYDGRVVVGSWYGEKRADLDLGGRFHRSRISLHSSQVSTVDPALRGRWSKERRLGVAWRRLADVDVSRLVTHRVPVESAPEAYRLLDEEPDSAVVVLLTYG